MLCIDFFNVLIVELCQFQIKPSIYQVSYLMSLFKLSVSKMSCRVKKTLIYDSIVIICDNEK